MSHSENTEPTPKADKTSPVIVGIGASAGGLAALKKFFAHVPSDSGLAYVIVVHLSPDHESHLHDLLQQHVNMPVQQVTETVALEANQVYVIPPGCNLNTIDTHLRLTDLEERRRDRAPIDHFFRTLASTHDGKSIGIILTGTGSDGTLGIKEIKERGGITIVQDPNEAEYDGMPQSAISTGMVDLVLPLHEIPGEVIRLAHIEPKVTLPKDNEDVKEEERQLLQKIFAQMRSHTARDFSRYKRSTIMRRLQRRMQIAQVVELQQYLNLLREKPEEVRALSDDFLITVTSFFRDTEVFHQLEEEVIPLLFEDKGPEDTVRVWSVGCATGEEAYSLAIVLLEEASRYEAPPRIQVFASDLHDHSLKKAREGYYPGDIETDVSPERLHRFFTKEDGSFRIRKEVREMVVFTPHNLLNDPPFSKIDLISCRNLLIYLQREVQRDVIDLFHYALNKEGFLLLGTSETLETTELFRTEHKTHCIFRKRNVPVPEPRLPVFPLTRPRLLSGADGDGKASEHIPTAAYGTLHQWMVERYAPPSMLISPDHKVVHFSEHVGRYLVHPGGEPTTSVFKLVREELRIELQAALHAARENRSAVHTKSIFVKIEGATQRVMLSVYPAREQQQEGFALVIFEETRVMSPSEQSGEPQAEASDTTHTDATIRELEAELSLTKHRLQAMIEEFETGQEEMKASNEEMQSTNEELRSTLEELETSKEELQSMNEELTTVNQENRHKVEELAQLSSDLQNLLKATDIATLFLDKQLRIMRFTPRVIDIFNVRTVDRGRPLADLTHRLGYNDLMHDAQQVLDMLVPIEHEVKDHKDRWYLTRVLPYRSSTDHIEGVVITFVDITGRKRAEEAVRKSEEQFRALVEASAQSVWTTDAKGEVTEDSPSWRAFTGQTFDEWKGRGWLNAVHPDNRAFAEESWQKAVDSKNHMNTMFRLKYAGGGWRWTTVRAVPLQNADGTIRGWIGMNIDITEQRQAEENLRRSEEHLQLILESATDYAIFTFDSEGKFTDWNAGAERIMGYSKEEIVGQHGSIIFTEEDQAAHVLEKEMRGASEAGRFENERWHMRKDGSRFWGSGATMPLRTSDHQPRGFLKIMTDHTERKLMEESLKQAKEEAERAAKAKEEFLAHMSHEIRTPLNAVVGLANLLLRQNPKEEQLENLQSLKFSANNLISLVNDILDFSKIQAGKVSVEETEVDLRELMDSMQKAHQFRATEQDNELLIHIDKAIPNIICTDQLKLSQVMHNLISNALKFTKQGLVNVDVSLNRKEGDRLWLDFSVRDTGIGIPKDKLEGIFEVFTQADISTVRQYGGTGLGLTITKLLLELMDSRIELESIEGDGSRFYFTLPVRESNTQSLASSKLAPAQEDEAMHPDMKLLLVEDVDINRMVLKQFLQEWWEITPDEASNGAEAVAMAQQEQYDMILMDIRMPVMDGYEATQKIRASTVKNYRHTPIIALTADSFNEVEKHQEARLFTDVITKPFEPQDLHQKVLRYAPGKNRLSANGKEKATKANNHTTTAFEVDITKVRTLFSQNTSQIHAFLEKAIVELTTYHQRSDAAMTARDEKEMENIIHKASLLIDMLSLQSLHDLLRRNHRLLKKKAPQDQVDKAKEAVAMNIERVIEALKLEVATPPHGDGVAPQERSQESED